MERTVTLGVTLGGVRCVHTEEVAQARRFLADDGTYRGLADLFTALADTTRAKIAHAPVRQQLCTCDLAAVVGVSESAVSQHLRVLRSLRVVQSRRAGKFVYYGLNDAHVAQLMHVGLTHLGHEAAPAETEPVAAAPVGADEEELWLHRT